MSNVPDLGLNLASLEAEAKQDVADRSNTCLTEKERVRARLQFLEKIRAAALDTPSLCENESAKRRKLDLDLDMIAS